MRKLFETKHERMVRRETKMDRRRNSGFVSMLRTRSDAMGRHVTDEVVSQARDVGAMKRDSDG